MNALTRALLGTAAISGLAMAPAQAQPKHPTMQIMALHQGRTVNKTKLHKQGATHVTYTVSAYDYLSFADSYKKWKPLGFYKWNNSSDPCTNPPQKLKVAKKTEYGKAKSATETYSIGCSNGPTTFYGVDYKITDPDAKGHTDHLNPVLTGKFHNGSSKYKGTMNINDNVFIE